MVALYNATDGPSWSNTNSWDWLSDAPLEEWHGVTTDDSGGVTELRLSHNRLSGNIPAKLGSLSNLKVLELSHNQLSGEIPPELGSLPNLEVLELSNNKLNGEMPPELGSLRYLQGLLLSVNQLVGEIPPELARLSTRPSRSGQRAFPVSVEQGVPELADFTSFERMAGEYRAMGIYPRGHLMEFVRPILSRDVLPASAVESMEEGREVMVAGWPVARQHSRGKEGTVFVTIEDETGDVQLILWAKVFAMRRRELGSQVILVLGVVSRWDGTTNIVVSNVRRVDTGVCQCQTPTTGIEE